jgi:formamidopyrimidine-DNA glycosylase
VPELPEVETIARGVDARVRGARIVAAWFSHYPQPMKTPPAEQERALAGCWFVTAHRVGKHLVCDLAQRQPNAATPNPVTFQWIVHLGMTGRLLVTHAETPVAAHTHARLTLADGREVRFVDARRFGRLELLDLRQVAPFSGPGSEPLTISREDFARLFRARRTSIKAALLDQSLLQGVGNIYADESLFRAGIRPHKIAARLTHSRLEQLRLALREVLVQAIELGGSSVSDYVDANGVKGFFQLEHRVYARGGQPCRVCGESIRRINLAGRGTHFCPCCQR